MESFAKLIGVIVIGMAMVIAISLLFAIPTYYLWNWIVPTIFGLKSLTLFQSWGLNALCGILFKTTTNTSK